MSAWLKWFSQYRVLVVVVGCLVACGCSSSSDDRGGLELGDADSSLVEVEDGHEPGGAESSPFTVKVASGYLTDLLDSTYGPEDIDYDLLQGPQDALGLPRIVVAGYLFEIVPGVTEVDTSERRSRTSGEVSIALAHIDALERRFEVEGAHESVWLELEEMRRSVIENQPRRARDHNYWAYRVRVTEVFKGDIDVGDIIDVQVFAGVNVASELVPPVLEGTPRVVVAGYLWGGITGELRNSSGEVVDKAIFPFSDLFWFDEGVWGLLVDDTAEGTSVVDESGSTGPDGPGPGSPGPGSGDLLGEDGTTQTGAETVIEESVGVGPALVAESHHLHSLDEMHQAWGVLETLDDLARALRTAASETAMSTTTTTPSTTTEAP